MIERERFEVWARQRWAHPEDFDQRIKAPSKYNNYEVQAAWEAWQERAAQPAPSVPDFANTKDAARYRWLRENGLANEKRESRAVLPRGGKKASMAFRYWTTPEELDMTIDAMISAAPEAKP